MALRPFLSASCNSCRVNVLRSFMSAAGIELSPLRERIGWHTPRTIQQTSSFSHRAPLFSQSDPLGAFEEDVQERRGSRKSRADRESRHLVPEQIEETRVERPATTPSHVPWYLQVDEPIERQQHPLAERQRLPELPESPPALLQPLLEHVSKELGMDDLSLLDLRSLDPPPALGGNLIMIIGTARSEKHLHVSADRLCRWLRSDHGLSPFADGLLGRNELKLKMRRKAKRSRLLSAVGAKATGEGEVDDGIRTGWVCVNVGKVEGGDLPRQQKEREVKGFVGFNTQTSGSRIVVQMMTEEKRGQIDLEALWNGILRRSDKSQDAAETETAEALNRVDKGHLIEKQVREQRSARSSAHNSADLSGSGVSNADSTQDARV